MYTNYIFYPLIFLFNQTNEISIPSLFHPFNQTKMRETKIFSIFLLFYSPTFQSLQPNEPLIKVIFSQDQLNEFFVIAIADSGSVFLSVLAFSFHSLFLVIESKMGLLYFFFSWVFDKFKKKLIKEVETSWCDLLLVYLRFVFYELRRDFLGFYKDLFLYFWVCERRFFGHEMGFSQLVMN